VGGGRGIFSRLTSIDVDGVRKRCWREGIDGGAELEK